MTRVQNVLYSRQEITIEQLRVVEVIPDRQGIVEGRLRFWDGSLLDFVEVLVEEGVILTKTDYAYHYQSAENKLVFRYDNAPHYPQVRTFPHHKHVGDEVEEATPPDFAEVLREIDKTLYPASNE